MVGSVKWDNIQNESHDRIKEKGNEKYVLGRAIFLVGHMYLVMKVRKSVGRREKPAVRPRKFSTHKNTRNLVKTS